MNRARYRSVTALLLALLTSVIWAAETLHIISLRHRPADDVVPLVRTLLRPTEAITGSGYQLFVRADTARLGEIERVVGALDVAQRQLTITVRQGLDREQNRARDRVTGKVVIGNSPTDSDVRYRGERRHETAQETHTQTLRVLDGRRAFIRMGQSVPVVQQILMLTGRGQIVSTSGIALHDISTGFDVLPRVRGENVIVEITPRLSAPRAADDTFRFQELQTTVTTRLGEWIDLGAITGQSSAVNRAILDSSRSNASNGGSIFLKVE